MAVATFAMPISIACSNCEKKLKVPDAAAGKKVRCPACQGVVAVPAAKAESPPAGEAITSVPAPAASVPAKSKAKSKPAAWDKDEKTDDEDEDKEKFEDDSRPAKKKKKASDDSFDLSEDEDEDEDDRPRKKRKRRKRDDDIDDDYGDLRRRRTSPHRGTTILTLGILTIFIACVCPLICWILGGRTINMANEDISRMDSGTMDRSGRGNTQIGKTCAIIGVVLGIINAIAGIILRIQGMN